MKLISFERNGKASYGVVVGERVIDLGKTFGGQYPTLRDLLAAGLDKIGDPSRYEADCAVADVKLLTPITNPAHIWCLAVNYADHHKEVESAGRVQDLPKEPAVFARYIDTFVAHGEDIWHPGVSEQFDYEGELAVVIGKEGYRIKAEDAFEHVAGYTILNDGSVRDWQFHTRQITPGKNFYRSGSIGPWIVTADEIGNPYDLRIDTRLNGELLQSDKAELMLHKIPRFIEYVSTMAPLQPGDILATGTPSGVGFSRKPPVWMRAGDTCEISIEKIGMLGNRIVQP
ncbi:fumarylacetoacetate hydrolase family protein [Variovorax sp. J2P1-59]|uniref:fumarylacetoacetate hydrolase family protein n=1 Tax=Variovorax flavidus TaxID=3053501 RepID=UPI002578FB78|nr:fumarylacetoacetate hydrolase family protein [Variovorax sp. J2P1-59]MDM0075852.1 fumarylacetoacetate hydrolase family protein [Variovorax sp. J2P1-59]